MCFPLFFWPFHTIIHVSCVCSRDKPINHILLYFPHSKRHNFLPTAVYPAARRHTHTHAPTPMLHIPLLFSCKSDEGHTSFCRRRTQNERLAFIHNGKVGARKGGCLVRKEMSCYRVMTTLVREQPRQHQRASNYNQFPAAKRVLKRVLERGCQRSGRRRGDSRVSAAARIVLLRTPRYWHLERQLVG